MKIMTGPMRVLILTGIALFASLTVGGVAQARTDRLDSEVSFKIPAQSLSTALVQFSKQAGLQLVTASTELGSLETGGISGRLTLRHALKELLNHTGLGYSLVGENTVAIAMAGQNGGERAQASAAGFSGTVIASAPNDSPSPSQGQGQGEDQEGSSGAATSSEADKGKISEIIVTATKRAESLKDIPLSVSVLDEQQLIKQGAVGLIDYATRVPNLSFGATSDNALGANSVAIRGVVGGGGSLGGGTTGFYIDDIPVPEFMNPKVIDISRIEVLRGPQGSLYGARSMGGTVRLITKRADPTAREFNVHAALSDVAEGGQDYAADTSFNIPISESAAFRGSAYYLSETGVHDIRIDNPIVSGDEVTLKNADDGEYWGLQAMVTWNVAENFTVEPRFIYQNSHIDWLQWSDGSPDNFTNTRVSRLADPNDLEWSISSLTLTWDRDWGRFTSASGYFEHDSDSREEYSVGANYLQIAYGAGLGNLGIGNGGDPTYYPPGGVLITRNQFTKQITEELRFTSEFDGRLQMTAGVFYSETKTDSNAPCTYTVGFNDAGNFPFGTDCLIASHFIQETDELAFFGEFEFAISRNLFLTAGGRYYDNSLDISNTRSGWILDEGAPSGPTLYGSQKEDGFNPKVAVKLEATDDWTVYASAAKGFRIGGANVTPAPQGLCDDDLAAIGISGSPDTFDSDSLWNYEVGSKSTHLDDRLSLNAAAFFIDWQDIIQGTSLACGFGFTNNTGKAEIKGFEFEVAARPVDRLTFNLGVGYAHGEVTDPEAAAGVLEGDPIPQVPEWTFSGDMEYRFPVNAREGYFFLGYRWVDESVSVNAGRSTPRIRDAYDLLDARLGMTFGNMDVSLYGKNLMNEHANLSDNQQLAFEVPGYRRYVVNRPRTIGIDFRHGF